jgi:hypothetical protein
VALATSEGLLPGRLPPRGDQRRGMVPPSVSGSTNPFRLRIVTMPCRKGGTKPSSLLQHNCKLENHTSVRVRFPRHLVRSPLNAGVNSHTQDSQGGTSTCTTPLFYPRGLGSPCRRRVPGRKARCRDPPHGFIRVCYHRDQVRLRGALTFPTPARPVALSLNRPAQ